MLFDQNTPLLGGGLALSVIAYGLFSAFVSGPEILAREAKKAQWPAQCQRMVIAELRSTQPTQSFQPNLDYRDVMRGVFGRDAGPLLRMMEPLGQLADQAQAHRRKAQQMNEERLRQKAQAAGSRCGCAVAMLSEKRVPVGLYAASGRFIQPAMFKNLTSELKSALHSPRCQITFGQ
ncbi:MAG: hypothetical protein AAGK79_16010 [Pseudomonadota bacterium]